MINWLVMLPSPTPTPLGTTETGEASEIIASRGVMDWLRSNTLECHKITRDTSQGFIDPGNGHLPVLDVKLLGVV